MTSPKSSCLLYLPLGSKLVVNNIKSEWAEVSICFHEIQVGVPNSHIVNLGHKIKDWVRIGTTGTHINGVEEIPRYRLLRLLQLSYQAYGEDIPRNTSQQIEIKKSC